MTSVRATGRYAYLAWFRDPSLRRDEQDHEWPAVFIVEADTAEAAQSWGDELASRRASRAGEEFLWSSVEPHLGAYDGPELPLIPFQVEISDDEIGW